MGVARLEQPNFIYSSNSYSNGKLTLASLTGPSISSDPSPANISHRQTRQQISSAANQTLVTAKRSTRTYLNPLISLSGASRYSNFASARHFYPQVSSRTAYKLIDDSDTGSASSNHSQGDKQEERPSLTLISSQVDELKRLLEAKLEHLNSRLTENTTSALVKLGSPCLRAHHCSAHIKGAHCRSEDFTCACLPQHVQYNSTFCLARKLRLRCYTYLGWCSLPPARSLANQPIPHQPACSAPSAWSIASASRGFLIATAIRRSALVPARTRL